MRTSRKPYPSDVSDEEWVLVVPYLTLLPEDAGQRQHPLREVFNGLRYLARHGIPWRAMPNDLPPMACGVRSSDAAAAGGLLRGAGARSPRGAAPGRGAGRGAFRGGARQPHTARSTPESGRRAGWDGHKRVRGSKLHLAVDTLGHLLALRVTAASENDRAAVAELAEAMQDVTGQSVDLAYVDQGYTGERPAEAASAHGIALAVVKLPEAKRGFVLLPRRWVLMPE